MTELKEVLKELRLLNRQISTVDKKVDKMKSEMDKLKSNNTTLKKITTQIERKAVKKSDVYVLDNHVSKVIKITEDTNRTISVSYKALWERIKNIPEPLTQFRRFYLLRTNTKFGAKAKNDTKEIRSDSPMILDLHIVSNSYAVHGYYPDFKEETSNSGFKDVTITPNNLNKSHISFVVHPNERIRVSALTKFMPGTTLVYVNVRSTPSAKIELSSDFFDTNLRNF